MADGMEDVTERFTADTADYVAAIQEAAADAQEFATANEEVQVSLDGLRDTAAEAGAALSAEAEEARAAAGAAGDLALAQANVKAATADVKSQVAELAAVQSAAGKDSDEYAAQLDLVAAAMRTQSDAAGELKRVQEEQALSTETDAMEIGHLRDEALEATAAMKGLKDAQSGGLGSSGGKGGKGGLPGGLSSGEDGAGGSGGLPGLPVLGSLGGALPLVAALLPLIMAALTEVGALATGFLAAGLGVASFAALAMPAFKQVFGALGDTKAQLAKLPEPVQEAVKGVKGLEDAFSKMSKAFEPTAFRVLNQGLQIANELLPYIGQFANAAAPAIENLLAQLSKGLASPEFKYFMNFLESMAGPVITAVGSGLAGLGKDVMILMERFSKKDVINAVNIAFRLLGFALTEVIGLIMEAMITWDFITQKALPAIRNAFDATRHAIATAGHDIAAVFDTVRHAVAIAGHDIASAFDTARHAVATAGHDIVAAFDAVINWLKSNWKLIVSILVDPIGAAVMEIRQHWTEIEQAFTAGWHAVMSALDSLRHDIAAAWDGARHDVAAIVDAIPGDIRKAWDTVRHDAAALGDYVLHALEASWNSVVSATSKAISDVLAFFQKLPGQIVSFLASLPGKMLSIGENVIKGLINGILNAAAAIPGIMAGLASDVASYFTNPLKLFSPSRLFFEHGFNIVQGAINGVRANAPNLLATMRGLGTGVGAQGIGSPLAAGAVAPAGGSSVHVTVPVTVQGGTSGVSPQYLQSLQATVQEAVLRHAQMNPSNGLAPAWGR